MVSPILQILASESSVGTAGSDFSGKPLIRVYNSTNADVVVTIKDSTTATIGTFTLKTYTEAFVRKMPTDTISASATIKMVPVAF